MILSRLAHPRWPRAIGRLAGRRGAAGRLRRWHHAVRTLRRRSASSPSATRRAPSPTTPAGNGRKYSVNGLDDDGNVDCRLHPVWVQSVASLYGFVFAECNPGG